MEKNTYYIAVNGNDGNSGTKESPFATLEGARDAIRILKNSSSLPEGGITVFIRGGVYQLVKTFLLEECDSGTPEKAIVYSAYRDEDVRIIGGIDLPAERLGPVTDPEILGRLSEQAREQIVQIDLKELGVTDYGRIEQVGYGFPFSVATPELFVNSTTMALARYPSNGYVKIEHVVDPGGNPRLFDQDAERLVEEQLKGAILTITDPRPFGWKNTGDLWMHGYWFWDWADANLRIASLDAAKGQLHTEQASHYSVRDGQRYFYYNVLEELDTPGEWYLDRESGIVYFYPPTPITEDCRVQLSLFDDTLVRLDGVSHVTFRKLTLEVSRGAGVHIKGGSHNLIAGCTLCKLGGFAVVIGEDTQTGANAGTDHRVLSCTIYDTGIGGIFLGGGDRTTLTPGRNEALNNEIFKYSRLKRTYSPAIQLHGVGNIAAHNEIHDAPHLGIFFHGNDHLIEFNNIYSVLTETGDAGAIYTGRDWSEQGNVIRFNHIHHINNDSSGGQVGVYLDDMASGVTILGNIFLDVDIPFVVGGGRNNSITNNLIINCRRSVYIDDRGKTGSWASYLVEDGTMQQRLEEVPYQVEPWRSKYPHLLTILQDEPGTPKYNTVARNILYRTGMIPYKNHLASDDILTIAPAVREHGTIEMNYEILGNLSKLVSYFELIPFGKIGRFEDEFGKGKVVT